MTSLEQDMLIPRCQEKRIGLTREKRRGLAHLCSSLFLSHYGITLPTLSSDNIITFFDESFLSFSEQEQSSM